MNYKKCWWCKRECHKESLVRIDHVTDFKVCPACLPKVPPLLLAGEYDDEPPLREPRVCKVRLDAA